MAMQSGRFGLLFSLGAVAVIGLMGGAQWFAMQPEQPSTPEPVVMEPAVFDLNQEDAVIEPAVAQADEFAVPDIDDLVAQVADIEGIEPLGLCDDSTFLRRVTVDLIGRIPTAKEYEQFWSEPKSERRKNLIERLLESPRFNSRWAVFFADMLRVRGNGTGQALDNYVRNCLKNHVPYDKMVADMLTGTGSTTSNPGLAFLLAEGLDPLEITGAMTQSLLGIRMKCAQCHDHPFDVWTREEYYELAAYFGKITLRAFGRESNLERVVESNSSNLRMPVPAGQDNSRSPLAKTVWPFESEEGYEERIVELVDVRVEKDLASGVIPESEKELVGDLLEVAFDTRAGAKSIEGKMDNERRRLKDKAASYRPAPTRDALAGLVTAKTNQYFAWNVVNRLWAVFFGKGFVMPVDDFRMDNPPSHPEMLNALSEEFVVSGYDFRQLIRAIVSSDTYQRKRMLGDVDEETREKYESQWASFPFRRMPSESLFDSIVTAGHLFDVKHPAGTFTRTLTRRVARRVYEDEEMMENKTEEGEQVEAETPEEGATPEEAATPEPQPEAGGQPQMMAQQQMMQTAEEAEGDIVNMLAPDIAMAYGHINEDAFFNAVDDPLAGVRPVMVNPVPEDEEEMMMEVQNERPFRIEFDEVSQTIDTNPRYASAIRSSTPAPLEHFLRQFGQVSRAVAGESRQTDPTMRQALMLLNGPMVNHAARVGKLERMYRILKSGDSVKAIKLAYVEILSRMPTRDELEEAQIIVDESDDKMGGMGDLRWVLMNSHEFKYLP